MGLITEVLAAAPHRRSAAPWACGPRSHPPSHFYVSDDSCVSWTSDAQKSPMLF